MNYFSNQRWSQKLTSIILAVRPWSFSASVTSTLLGLCLAWKENNSIDIIQAIFTIATVLSIHGAGNLVNTYYDFIKGFDAKDSDDKTLVDKSLSPNEIVACITESYIMGIMCFIAIYLRSDGNTLLVIGLFLCGVLSSFIYTGGIGLKYMALGDILILLSFGALTTVFGYLNQTGEISLGVIIYAIPLALNTEAILHGNNTRDLESDKSAGAVTLAILLGKQYACAMYCLLLIGSYAVMCVLALNSSWTLLFPFVTAPLAVQLSFQCFHGDMTMIPQKTAQLNLMFGLLYLTGLIIS